MNVLQVNTVFPNGSTGRIMAEIADYTAKQEDSHAFAAFGIGEAVQRENVTTIMLGRPWERKYHGAIRKLFDAEGYGSRMATDRLIRFCKDNRINVIHMHNLHGCYLNLKRWFTYLREANLPVIWTLHDCWAVTGHCAHFTYIGCEKWKTECSACPQLRSYPECIGLDGSRRNFRLKRRLFTAVPKLTLVTPCRWLEGIVQKAFLAKIPTRVIYNGVDTKRFRPTVSGIRQEYGLQNQKLLLAVASVWTDRKGLNVLTELSQWLGDGYRIAVLGLSGQQIKTLPECILGVEPISSTELLCAWYSAADCFINPTLEDTMPLVNLEALACGTPVVAFRTGGCPEVITDDCGAIVPWGNAQSMAEAVRTVCALEADVTQACRAQAERFSMETTLRAYDALYREVL